MECCWCWAVLLGKGLYFFRCIFFLSRFSLLSADLISVCFLLFLLFLHLFFIHFNVCFPVPFPSVPARATSHFSPLLLFSAWMCLISAIVIPVFCSSDKEAASSARWWLFCGSGVAPSPLRAAMLLSTSLWARSSLVWLSPSAASQQGRCPGDVLDRWRRWPQLWVQDYLVGRKDRFPPLLSLPEKRSWHSVLEGGSLLVCLPRRKIKLLVAFVKNMSAVFVGMDCG